MAISYPLVIPGAIGPLKANLKKYDAVGENIGPFDGTAEVQQWQDQHWELELAWPSMTWEQFAELDAFSGALHGKLGTFLWGPPLATGPRGSGSGMPVVLAPPQGELISLARAGGVVTAILTYVPPAPSQYFNPPAVMGVASSDGAFNGNFPSVASGPIIILGTLYTFINWFQAGPTVATETVTGTVTPVFNQSGDNQLVTAAWMPSQSGLLLPGDFFQLIANDTKGVPKQRLYQYINPNPLSSDGGGNAVLDIFPSLREVPAVGAPLTLLYPAGTFRLAENRREAPAEKTKTFTFQLKAREAI